MSIKLTDTQLVMLSAAAQREDRSLTPPENLKGAAVHKVAAKLIAAGLVKEIQAKVGTPVWRRDKQNGQSYALKLTAAGANTIAVDLADDATPAGDCLVPPTGSKRGQAQKAIVKLLEAGAVKEIRAKAGAPIWRRDGERGHIYALKLTAAGAKTIAVDETPPSQGEAERRADHLMVSVDPKPEPGSAPAAFVDRAKGGVASTPKFARRGTKIAGVIELLQGSDGVTLAELVANTGWLPHTARAALTGLRKRGHAVVIDRTDKARGSVYRIEPSEMGCDSTLHTAAEATGKARPNRPERRASPRSRQAA